MAQADSKTTTTVDPADPIFAMIVMHKKLTADWQGLYDQLHQAEFNAAKEHGHRPIELIHWRNYYIGASEIDTRRQTLLEAGEIDPATIEQEYLDANARYEVQVAAGLAWDERTGLATLRNDVDRGVAATERYAKRLANTKPATPFDAAVMALVIFFVPDPAKGADGPASRDVLRNEGGPNCLPRLNDARKKYETQ